MIFFVEHFEFPKELLGKTVVGNGGFSLRSKKMLSLCAKLAKENAFQKSHPEDLVICVYDRKLIEENGIKFAPYEVAKNFSFEGEFGERKDWNGEFGFHGYRWTDISKWLEKNPEYVLDRENGILRKI